MEIIKEERLRTYEAKEGDITYRYLVTEDSQSNKTFQAEALCGEPAVAFASARITEMQVIVSIHDRNHASSRNAITAKFIGDIETLESDEDEN